MTAIGFDVVSDDERRDAQKRWNPVWDEIADRVRDGRTVKVHGVTRQGIAIAMKRRDLTVHIAKREDGWVVWS